MQNSTFEIYNETKNPILNWSFLYKKFQEIKTEILGNNFCLNLNILLPLNAKKINIKARKKTYIPNTLSFKYSKNSGEIVLTPHIVKKENYSVGTHTITKIENKFIYLFIHSCLHLCDHDHGPKMDKLELKLLKQFVV